MTSAKPFGTVPPGAKQQPTPFELHVEDEKIQNLKTLLKLSPIAKETYENLRDDGSHGQFGVSRKWVVDAKKYWEEKFDWRVHESRINSFPAFKTDITDDDGGIYNVHFTALFSKNPSAIPIAFLHGWPGSFLEFLPIMSLLRDKYTPDTLPYHIIVPSLTGFGLSSDPPLDKDWKLADTSRIMHKLLLSLGFDKYLAQGGDIGSLVSRTLVAAYEECKGIHLNFFLDYEMIQNPPSNDNLSEQEQKGLQRMGDFLTTGMAYAQMHGTKPSTIGLVLSSSPIAQLAWIGEKFLAWSDPSTTPPLDEILAGVSLYWLAGCYPTSIYTYRESLSCAKTDKPVGYSCFPWDLASVPRAWVEKAVRLVSFKEHSQGGHFAALERLEALLADVEEFAKVVWK
ncbi:Alpha/Beta hydrolase protein [Phaeosphaeriaceae sp. PMI808]|nr:Alpha/Beta hydrolase protein [Phaeosphaeriaceae sp. PMI808]